jgi:Ribosomal protein L10
MPNATVLSEKQAIVEVIAERISGASAGVFVDYKGINVAQDTQLRADLRKNDINYTVLKNSLMRFALNKVGLADLDSILEGTTSLATSTADPIAPFRIISEYSKKLNGIFTIKAGFMDNKVLSTAEIEEISKLESKDALYSTVFGTMLAPITSLAVVLGQILEAKGGSAEAGAAEAATEKPAAEEPAAEEPAVEESAVEEPAAEEPAAE